VTRLGRLGAALRSLRWRLTLTYLALIAVLLAALGAFQYETLYGSLVASRVSELKVEAAAANAAYRSEVASGSVTATARDRRLTVFAELVLQAFGARATVALYGPSGSRVLVRPAGTDPPQLDPATFEAVATDAAVRDQVVSAVGGDALVVGFPVGTVDLRTAAPVVEISEPMQPVYTVLGGDLEMLALGGGAVLLLALLVGLALTSRALRPLRRLTATSRALAGGDLRARSRLEPRSDEVGELAHAFDHMADRIEAAFTAQRESEARVRRFVADASHELRTPVTALSGYVEVLRRGAAESPGSLDAALGAMAREADRLRVLVLDLLTLARLDAQGSDRPQHPEDVDVAQLVGRLLDEGVPGMPALVVRDLPASPVMARCDRSAVTTVVRNLLVNACKYAPGARQVWSVRADAGRVRVDAHDDGPGIPAADLPHVFERFYRGEKTRSREEGGSGLGLSIVRGLVQAQGGEVAIASTEGAGTTVTVWLPLAPAPPAAASEAVAPPS
jgi:two-component system OmpR family sensor kinase